MNNQTVYIAINEVKTNIQLVKTYIWQRRKKIAFWTFLLLMLWKKEIGWQVNAQNVDYSTAVQSQIEEWNEKLAVVSIEANDPIFHNGVLIGDEWDDSEPTDRPPSEPSGLSIWSNYTTPSSSPIKKDKIKPSDKNNLANTFSNLTFWADNPEKKEVLSKQDIKRQKQLEYVKRFAKTAQVEMQKYGIPASITLAQGLLESNVGESRLATNNNNHFGIKCFSKKCTAGHCSNFTDDTHKDFFRKYSSTWESFRAHSQLLQAKRYKPLYKLKKTDYKSWAHGLKKAGYATDKKYAFKIIQLVESLRLYDLDKEG